MTTETPEERLELQRDEARAIAEDYGRILSVLTRKFHTQNHPTRPPFWRCLEWPCNDVKPLGPWDR